MSNLTDQLDAINVATAAYENFVTDLMQCNTALTKDEREQVVALREEVKQLMKEAAHTESLGLAQDLASLKQEVQVVP